MCRGGNSWASFSRVTPLVNIPLRTPIIALKGERWVKIIFRVCRALLWGLRIGLNFNNDFLKTKIGFHPEDAHLCTICNRDVLYGHGRHENEDFAYDFWSYPYLKIVSRRHDRATRFAIVSKCALRGSRRSPFSILQFRRDWLARFACKL